jgi:uroporphyrinogen-III decarboxylase
MNNRERILTILNGQLPDRMPWIPRLEIWYEACRRANTLPSQWQNMSLRQIERELGLGTPAREGKVYDRVREGVEIIHQQDGERSVLSYHTPLGTLQQVTVQTEERWRLSLPPVVVEHLLKGPQDYKIWEWIVQHTTYTPAFDAYSRYDETIGEDGLPMVMAEFSPFYFYLESLAGYNQAFYQLADYPVEVNHLLAVMAEVQKDREWPIIANSPARLILTDAHISTQFTPPRIFMEYIYPYQRELNDFLHAHAKSTAMHADADTSGILKLIEQTGWDMVECYVTAPMVPVSLEQARQAWGNRVIIWGGIPSLMLSPSVSEVEFQAYCRRAFEIIGFGEAFILGVADNVMPDSLIERIAWINENLP